MTPKQLAVCVKRRKNSLRALHKNVAGFGIHRCARSSIALIDSVAQKIIIQSLPEFFPGLGIEKRDTFLEIRSLDQIAEDIKVAVGDNRWGLAGQIRDPEGWHGFQFNRQTLIELGSDLFLPTPV